MADDINQLLPEESDIIIWNVENLPNHHVAIDSGDLATVIEKAVSAGASEIYHCTEPEAGYPGIAWRVNDLTHVYHTGDYVEPELPEDEIEDSQSDEDRRIDELADEILDNYRELLGDDEIYRFEENREILRVENLLRKREEIEEEARADPETEKAAAEWLAEHEKFNLNSSTVDAELLIEESEFDMDEVRVEPVRKRARAILNTQ
ncbi:hypothetical protein L593_14435 [Salinarchaeum sp. Harcht-Bsk1]|uniref:hypothetical protein n=1 Tax=Salinarchaeum sp. Harcht-Bsk1 TaxID=1333523 RepID=UPI0003424863|nr:hypothetical protein [Salinarchaeum sp. Harcht-Bsk1]AGN02826.1 hypothetical protein L593_14435 [Salinarchaeum sp. Harcht-Bsk1]